MSESKLTERVKGWIEKTGLPLELQTVSDFRSAGFDAEHSSVYVDPESDKGREIDVVAYSRDALGLLYMFAVVECKASPNPWVVVVNESDPKRGVFGSIGVVEKRAEGLLPDGFWMRGETAFKLRSSFTGGYALRQAFSNESDPAYTASLSVLKAAVAVIKSYTLSKPRLLFAVPVIVVEAPIFECSFSKSHELTLRQVKSSEFIFTAHIPDRTRAVIRVVHRESLPAFSKWLWRLAETLKSELKPTLDRMLEAHRSNHVA
jgi:hypothetical protein